MSLCYTDDRRYGRPTPNDRNHTNQSRHHEVSLVTWAHCLEQLVFCQPRSILSLRKTLVGAYSLALLTTKRSQETTQIMQEKP